MVESEKKLRLLNLFTLKTSSGIIAINTLKSAKQFNDGAMASRAVTDVHAQIQALSGLQQAFQATVVINKNVITFLAGYTSFKMNRNVSCSLCRSLIVTDDRFQIDIDWAQLPEDVLDTSYVDALSRGGLLMPSPAVYYAAEAAVRIAQCLVGDQYVDKFLKMSNQRNLLHTLAVMYASSHTQVAPLCGAACAECETNPVQYLEGVAMRMTNILLNNYTKDRNSAKRVPGNKKPRH